MKSIMVVLSFFLSLVSFGSFAFAAPVDTGSDAVFDDNNYNTTLIARNAQGRATWYNTYHPTFSACGSQPNDGMFVAAVSRRFHPGSCFRNARVTRLDGGASVVVNIQELCPSCEGPGREDIVLDLTPAAWAVISYNDPGARPIPIRWEFI